MQLYFLRHGHAEDGYNMNDHDRQLTDDGSARMQTAAQVMARLDLNLTKIYSSPRIRAKQTAQAVADALGMPIEITEACNFGFSVSHVQQMAKAHGGNDSLMFVGHNPSMTDVVSELTGTRFMMKKGGLARVDTIGNTVAGAELVWLIAPKVFDNLDG